MTQTNPYAPPKFACHRDIETLPILPSSRWDEIHIRAAVCRGWWRRRVTLNGTINANLEYNPMGSGERVYVDGQLIVTTSVFGWEVVQPHIDFYLEAFEHAVPASIDVRASVVCFFKTYGFRLTVAGKTVYDEVAALRNRVPPLETP